MANLVGLRAITAARLEIKNLSDAVTREERLRPRSLLPPAMQLLRFLDRGRPNVPVDEYLSALRTEVNLRYPAGQPWGADTLYFGGGTPSRIGANGVTRLMELMRDRIELAPDAEVTLEANAISFSSSVRLYQPARRPAPPGS